MTHGPSNVDLGGLEGLGLVEGIVWNRTLGLRDSHQGMMSDGVINLQRLFTSVTVC